MAQLHNSTSTTDAVSSRYCTCLPDVVSEIEIGLDLESHQNRGWSWDRKRKTNIELVTGHQSVPAGEYLNSTWAPTYGAITNLVLKRLLIVFSWNNYLFVSPIGKNSRYVAGCGGFYSFLWVKDYGVRILGLLFVVSLSRVQDIGI